MTEISKRAQKTLELIKNGRFYMDYDPNLPATIKELLEAKLIVRITRATTYVASFAPADGYIPMRPETFDHHASYKVAQLEIAAPELLAALKALEPYFDGIVCFASSMDEYEPNRLVKNARDIIAKAEGRAS